MTNEELIKDKVQAATRLLLEVMVLMPPTSSPAPRFQIVWESKDPDQGQEDSYKARREQIHVLQFPTKIKTSSAEKDRQGDTLATPKKEGQMNITVDIPGISINAKPRSDGRFQGYATRDGKKTYFYGKTREDVERKIAQFWKEGQTERKHREAQKKNSPTFGEFTEKWIRLYKAPKLKPLSLETVRASLKYALSRFSEKQIAEISADDLQELLISITGSRIRQQCQSNLNQIFKKAYLQGIIKRNPCEAVELQPHKYEKKLALTLSEENAFNDETEGTKYSLLCRLILATGLRIGEALALLKSDIDFERRTVTVSKNVIFLEGERIEQSTPKTDAANRTLPLPDAICEELKAIKTELLFPFSYNSVRLFISRIAKKLKIKVSFHILRHTYATRLEEAGIPPKIKQYLMGHASLRMTQEVYTDTQKDYVESVSDRIRDLFTPKKT